MAVVENAGTGVMGSSNLDASPLDVVRDRRQQSTNSVGNTLKSTNHVDQNDHHQLGQYTIDGNGLSLGKKMNEDDGGREAFKREMRDLEEILSKLNPMAEEFVPPSLRVFGSGGQPRLLIAPPLVAAAAAGQFGYNATGYSTQHHASCGVAAVNSFRGEKFGYNGKRTVNSRTKMAQSDDVIRRTVYLCDIDHQVTEEQLAVLFVSCGQVVDCRVCGDPHSVLRFAFVEFTNEQGAKNALSLDGTMLGYYPLRVLPSKTAIAPVNPTLLPRSEDERKMCARTIYCTNIEKKVTQEDVKHFFESICGKVYRLRLLGDFHHSTRIAFVEFVQAESAITALKCSGAVLGSLPIR